MDCQDANPNWDKICITGKGGWGHSWIVNAVQDDGTVQKQFQS